MSCGWLYEFVKAVRNRNSQTGTKMNQNLKKWIMKESFAGKLRKHVCFLTFRYQNENWKIKKVKHCTWHRHGMSGYEHVGRGKKLFILIFSFLMRHSHGFSKKLFKMIVLSICYQKFLNLLHLCKFEKDSVE